MTRVWTDEDGDWLEGKDMELGARRGTSVRQDLEAFASAILERFGGCSPEEKREAEREAARWGATTGASGRENQYRGIDKFAGWQQALDKKYPSLTPEPPTVTLSNGEEYRRSNRCWQWKPKGDSHWSELSNEYTPACETAEDFEKCRDLLRAEEQAK